MMNLYDKFHTLLAMQRQKLVIEHGLYMSDDKDKLITDGIAVVDYYKKILNQPLNGTGKIIENMDFRELYTNCIGCGTISKKNSHKDSLGNIFHIMGTFQLPYEFDIFHVRPEFCDENCIEKLVSRINKG